MEVKYKTGTFADTFYVKEKNEVNKTQDDYYDFRDMKENYMKFWIKE